LTKKGIALLGFALLGLGGAAAAAGASSPSSPSSPRPKPPRRGGTGTPEPWTPPEPSEPEPYWIGLGWFWWFLDWTKDGAAFAAFTAEHAGNLMVRKTWGHGGTHHVVLFEVTKEPLDWTLPGWPTPAPKGAATELSDIEGGPEPEPASAWRDWLTDMAGRSVEQVQAYDQAFQHWLTETIETLKGAN